MSLSPTVILIDARPCTTSLAIAECFGKNHKEVMRDIRNLLEQCPANFSERNFALASYQDEQRKSRPLYNVYFDGFMLLVMGYTGKKALEMKLAYIAAFNAMRAKIDNLENEQLPSSPNAPITPDQQCTLRAIVDSKVYQVSGASGPLRRVVYSKIWRGLKAHFRVAEYRQLPQSKMNEAIAFLVQFDASLKKEAKEELPHGDKQPMARFRQRVELEGKYREYLEAVEKWRLDNRAQSKRLYEMGLDLLQPERCGSAIFDAYAAVLGQWLEKTANSNFSVFDGYLDSTRAPVILAAQLNASFELPKILR